MKKIIFAVVMILSLVLSSLSFAQEQVAPLTVDEVDTYLEWLREEAMKDETLEVVEGQEEGLYYASFTGGVLVLADRELTENTAIVRAELGVNTEDVRSLSVLQGEGEEMGGLFMQDVLSAYPCSNPDLYGTYDRAVIVMDGSLPGNAFAGVAERQGQHVEKLVYRAYESVGDTVAQAQVEYYFSENQLMGITVYGRGESEFAAEEMNAFAALQEENDYFAYPSDFDGSRLDQFAREDLVFSGMDFLSLTAEKMTDRFGSPVSDEWMEDTDGKYIRLMTWNGVELTLCYDENKEFEKVSSLNVTAPMLEGPRGVCMDDSMNSIMLRFRHGEGENKGNALNLYGDGENAPCGTLSYEGNGAYLTYVTKTPDGDAALQMNCEGMRLTSYTLVLLENE